MIAFFLSILLLLLPESRPIHIELRTCAGGYNSERTPFFQPEEHRAPGALGVWGVHRVGKVDPLILCTNRHKSQAQPQDAGVWNTPKEA